MARRGNPILSRQEIIETMRYLGWETHTDDGRLTEEAYEVSSRLAKEGVVENALLTTKIAMAVDKFRAAKTTNNERTSHD